MSTFTESSVIGSVTVTPSRTVEVRRDDVVYKDGQPFGGPVYHRHVLTPGDALDGEDALVRAIAGAAWTPEVIAQWAAAGPAAPPSLP